MKLIQRLVSIVEHVQVFAQLVLQKRNKIVVALSNALIMFTIFATCEGSLAKCENRLAVSMKKGAPGG